MTSRQAEARLGARALVFVDAEARLVSGTSSG